jgi:predicted metal-dependent phosphoesterase TrpH
VRWRALLPALVVGACAAPEPAPRPLRDFRGIIHCHSLYSHDSKGTYEEILAAAKAAKVDFVCMTDHPPKGDPGLSLREGWKGLHDGVLFIQGHELAGSNLLAIGIREPVRGETPAEKIAEIHRQGGVAIVSHPEEVEDWEPYLTADGMEVFNVHAAFMKLRKNPAKLAAALKAVKEDPDNSFRHLQELDPAVLAKWDELNKTRRFVGIAGNDSHQNVNILGLQLDPYPRAFRFVSTHVEAEELTEAAILRALREGRCHVAFDRTPGMPGKPNSGWGRSIVAVGGDPWRIFNGRSESCDLDPSHVWK